MRLAGWILAVAFTAPAAWAGEVTVTVASGRITLAATTTPVSDVLDQLARKTGMRVIYDGPPPRLLVSPRVERETVSQAVQALLEGLGLSYVLLTDPTSIRVETLFIASGGGPASIGTPTREATKPPAHEPPPRHPVDEDEDEEPMRPMPQPEPEPQKPSPPPAPTHSLSPFAPQPMQPYIPGVTPQPVTPGQPFIPGITPPSPPPPQ